LGIPAFFFFINFAIFELRLLYNLWRNQNIGELNNPNQIRKRLIKFYITFYIFLFLSLVFVTKFYFEKIYIIAAFIITWIPQIIHNAVYRNQISLPLITIFLNSLNKVIIPVYFRGCPKNIFRVKPDLGFLLIALSIVGVEIVILVMQTCWNPRFFIPCKQRVAEHKYYYSKNELLALKPEFEKVTKLTFKIN
jgi:hypothetical protein